MPDVRELMDTNSRLVRKWGRKLVALQDYSAPVPTTFFDTTTKTPVLPADAKVLGYITTDGVVLPSSVSTEPTNMDQDLEPVRTDITGIDKSVTAAFGESSSSWLHALRHGQPCSAWPAKKDAPWVFDDGDFVDFPYYRLWLISADGPEEAAFYRVEYGYRAKVTATNDRTHARSTNESIGFTFGLFKDPVVGKSLATMENGPGFDVEPETP